MATLPDEADGHGPVPTRPRVVALDKARGLAVGAMVVYHAAWDLSALRLIETEITTVPAWNLFARSIAATFLILSGLSLVLAHGRALRLRAFARRLLVLAAAAGAVTLGTWFAFPDSYVFFGILHALAVSSLVALPFLRAPAIVPAVAALGIGLVSLAGVPVVDASALAFLGLGTTAPVTNDFVPIVPWTAFLLAGVALGRAGLIRPAGEGAPGVRGGPLAAVGRHSLLVYLLHQPVLYGLLSALVAAAGPNPAAEAAPFQRTCLARCTGSGEGEGACRRACGCVESGLKAQSLWRGVVRDALPPADMPKVAALARSCLSGAGSAPPP